MLLVKYLVAVVVRCWFVYVVPFDLAKGRNLATVFAHRSKEFVFATRWETSGVPLQDSKLVDVRVFRSHSCDFVRGIRSFSAL